MNRVELGQARDDFRFEEQESANREYHGQREEEYPDDLDGVHLNSTSESEKNDFVKNKLEGEEHTW